MYVAGLRKLDPVEIVAEAARRRWPDLKVVLTSGYLGPEELPDDMAFVLKPWRTRDIAEAVTGPD